MSDKYELPARIYLRTYDSTNWQEAFESRSVDWDDQPDARARLNAEYVRADSLPGWISVDERLPDINVPVLGIDGGVIVVVMLEGDTWYQTHTVGIDPPLAFVTHWMPLPEGPEL